MSSAAIFVFCAHALLYQLAFGQLLQPNFGTNTIVEKSIIGSNVATGPLGLTGGLVKPGNSLGLVGNGFGLSNGFGPAVNALNVAENILDAAENGVGLAGSGLGLIGNIAFGGEGYLDVAAISGPGVLPVSSYSPIVPGGLTVVSNNGIEGGIVVNGDVPFLSAVGFEGSMMTDGAGATKCGCGDGDIGIVRENIVPVAGVAGLGINNGLGTGLGTGIVAGMGAGLNPGLGVGLGRLGGNMPATGLGNRGLGGRLY